MSKNIGHPISGSGGKKGSLVRYGKVGMLCVSVLDIVCFVCDSDLSPKGFVLKVDHWVSL